MTRSIRVFVSSLLALFLVPIGAFIAHGQEIYRGKTIHFLVAYSPGGVLRRCKVLP
jgi:hypothetical protein